MKKLEDLFDSYFEPALRLHVFLMLNAYGWGKILGGQFHQKGHLPIEAAGTTLGQVTGFDLCWAFFGYSFAYVLFIGIVQVLGAFLLLFNRTKLLGTAILLPILLNIIVVDICFEVPGAATWNAIAYLLSLLLVAYINRVQVLTIWRQMVALPSEQETNLAKKLSRLMVVAALAIAMMFAVLGVGWVF